MTKGRKNSYCVARSSGSRDPRQLQMRRRVAARPSSGSRQTASSPDSLRVGAPRPNYLLLVPSVVDRAAPSGVVPGELGGAAVLGARSGFAEGSYHRSGARGAASAIASQHNHARIVPHPSRANSAGPRLPAGRLAVVAWGRLTLPGPPLVWCWMRWLGWLGVAEGSAPPGRRVIGWPGRAALAQPAHIGGRVGILAGPRVAAVDPGPGGCLAVTELLARVGGSSVTANCPAPTEGGRHVDMVVGADHRGRVGVGVWRDAASRPLTARRQRPGHG